MKPLTYILLRLVPLTLCLPTGSSSSSSRSISSRSISIIGDILVPHKYIVTLKPNITDAQQAASHLAWANNVHGNSVKRSNSLLQGIEHVWTHSFMGYSGEFDAATILLIEHSVDVSSFSSCVCCSFNHNCSPLVVFSSSFFFKFISRENKEKTEW
jgi:hypothetical protein